MLAVSYFPWTSITTNDGSGGPVGHWSFFLLMLLIFFHQLLEQQAVFMWKNLTPPTWRLSLALLQESRKQKKARNTWLVSLFPALLKELCFIKFIYQIWLLFLLAGKEREVAKNEEKHLLMPKIKLEENINEIDDAMVDQISAVDEDCSRGMKSK